MSGAAPMPPWARVDDLGADDPDPLWLREARTRAFLGGYELDEDALRDPDADDPLDRLWSASAGRFLESDEEPRR